VRVNRGPDTNNVICGQAARHVIVHAGAVVDARMVRQVSGAKPRTLKPNIAEKQPLKFSPQEVRELGASMKVYVDAVCEELSVKFGGPPATELT